MWETFWPWLQAHEYIAVWLEGIALVLILGLDWRERQERRREQEVQRQEMLAQLDIAGSHADATKKSADAAAVAAEAMKKSADAATEAALAAKKSAEIATALNRPFIGVPSIKLEGGRGTRLWHISFALKNYGTLPALDVKLSADFFTDNILRAHERARHSGYFSIGGVLLSYSV
jgi:hypothetical protein